MIPYRAGWNIPVFFFLICIGITVSGLPARSQTTQNLTGSTPAPRTGLPTSQDEILAFLRIRNLPGGPELNSLFSSGYSTAGTGPAPIKKTNEPSPPTSPPIPSRPIPSPSDGHADATIATPAVQTPVADYSFPVPKNFVPFSKPVVAGSPQRSSAKPGQVSETEEYSVSPLDRDYLSSYLENAWRIVTAPVRFDQSDWLVGGGLVATTGLLMVLDEDIRKTWQDDIRSGFLNDISDVVENFGESQYIAIGAAASYAIAELADSPKDKEAALLVAQSFVLSAGFSQLLKMGFRRGRPDDNRGKQWEFFSSSSSKTNSSFPSGHATNAFSLATVLTEVYKPKIPWIGWALYPLATATALSRVNSESHWLSDVFVGSALGYLIGKMVVRYSPFGRHDQLSLEPLAVGDYAGLKLKFNY